MKRSRFLTLKPYLARLRRLDVTPFQRARGRRDDRILRARVPALEDYGSLAAASRARFEQKHAEYVRSISDDVMAASLELSVFMDVFCRITGPSRVVDLGSGFSSYVLRRFSASASHPCEVHSVDDHEGWLERTREFLEDQGEDGERLWHWPEFLDRVEPGTFDLVLHDMGSMEFRAESLERALALVKPGGVALLDDVHKRRYREHVHALLGASGTEWLSLKVLTGDRKARYAYLVFV